MQEQSESPVQTGPSTLTLRAAALRMAPGPPPKGLQCPQHGVLWLWDGAQPAATHLPGWSGYLCLQYASSDAYTFSRNASTSAGLERPFESERQGKKHQPGASRCAGRRGTPPHTPSPHTPLPCAPLPGAQPPPTLPAPPVQTSAGHDLDSVSAP